QSPCSATFSPSLHDALPISLGVNAGGRLIVNGTTVVNLPNSTGAFQAATGTIALPIGTASIELQAFDNGAPEVVLRYMAPGGQLDRKSTRLNSSHQIISYAV